MSIPHPIFPQHRGELAMTTGGPGLADIEQPVADLPALEGERETVSLPQPRAGHPNQHRASWSLERCTGGWLLRLHSWPSENVLSEVTDVLHGQRHFIHRLSVDLEFTLPSKGYIAPIVATVEDVLPASQVGWWSCSKLVRRTNGYRNYDPLRRRGGHLSTIF